MPEHASATTDPGPVVLSLPVADRPTASAFYRAFLGQAPAGEAQDDGEPEPLQFLVNPGLRLMLIPEDGFGWVIGDHEVAGRGTVEMLLSREARSEAAVRWLADVAASAGGSVVTAAANRPWGYAALVADPDGHVWQIIAAPGDAH
jgi:predicted lactoylglutathione lyase